MKILITGGAGYIGSKLATKLLELNFNVTVLDDLSTGHEQLIPFGVEFIKTNINDTKTLDILFKKKKFDVLMHFAGFIQVEESVKFPEKYFNNNY